MKEDDNPFPTKSGLDVNYLVRSKLFRVPRSLTRNPKTCIKQLEMLKEVELLQNLQVQRSLISLMEELNFDKRNSIGELQSARDFHKCHDNVRRIRKHLQDKVDGREKSSVPKASPNIKHTNSSYLKGVHEPTRIRNADLSTEKQVSRYSKECQTTTKTVSGPKTAPRKVEGKIKLPSLVSGDVNSRAATSSLIFSQDSVPQQCCTDSQFIQLPQVEPNIHRSSKSIQFQYCLPVLDSKSKFSILRMARALRQNRLKINEEIQTKEKTEPAQKAIAREKFELFADNYDLLFPRYLCSPGCDQEPMKFLDSDSFDEIDCDDFLHLRNRIVTLSPIPAVIRKNKQMKILTKLELRRGFR